MIKRQTSIYKVHVATLLCLTMFQWNLALALDPLAWCCRGDYDRTLPLLRDIFPRPFSISHEGATSPKTFEEFKKGGNVKLQCLCSNDLMLLLPTSSSFYLHVVLKGSYSCCPHHHLHVQVFQFVTSPCRMFWTNVAWILKDKVHVATLCVIVLSIFFWCVDVDSGFPISMRTFSF